MNTFVFTFGSYHSKFAHKCVKIKAISAEEAKKKMIEISNNDWQEQYSEEEWIKRIEQVQRVSHPIEQEISINDILKVRN